MIDYSVYPLPKDIKEELMQLHIDYVFQPIFDSERNLCAYEALMRPEGCSPLALIDQYDRMGKLHVLEVATFFGAFQEYERRGYKVNVSINSFCSELMTEEETKIFNECFEKSKDNGIVELIDLGSEKKDVWKCKQEVLRMHNIYVLIDEYEGGFSGKRMLDTYVPNIVKLDRLLIADIDKDTEKQKKCIKLIDKLHKQGILTLAEGVETEEETDYLVSIGIDLLQGFYLGIPE